MCIMNVLRSVGFRGFLFGVLSAETLWNTLCADVGSVKGASSISLARSMACTPNEGLLCDGEMTHVA